jgi:hypothetical protein
VVLLLVVAVGADVTIATSGANAERLGALPWME